MPIVDLHCDTLTVCQEAGVDLTCGQTQLSLDQIDRGEGWCQAFAVFIPDEYRGQAAVDYFCRNLAYFRRQLEKFPGRLVQVTTAAQIRSALEAGKAAALLTVEGGCVLEGKEERIPWLAEEGVRMLTLTWNGANELAGGVREDTGLTEFGRAAVPLLEDSGIVVDLSHLGDKAFDQVMEILRRPPVASHSNSRTICPHRRNLTDRQFCQIVRRGGLVGLNFFVRFLGEDPAAVDLKTLCRHIRHFVQLGGEDHLALGSDFDGADMPPCLSQAEKLAHLGEGMLELGISRQLAEKILWKNACCFFERYGL
ncbi:MAG TPA: dipeptidase [Firmicutes bacterium]|nr:dipeptidase [Bacillota bacterium]